MYYVSNMNKNEKESDTQIHNDSADPWNVYQHLKILAAKQMSETQKLYLDFYISTLPFSL